MVGSFGGVCRDLHRHVTSKRRILSHGGVDQVRDAVAESEPERPDAPEPHRPERER